MRLTLTSLSHRQKRKVLLGTLLSVMWQPGWEDSLEEDGYVCIHIHMYTYTYGYVCICMAESLHHPPKSITTLLIGYNPI